MRTKIRVLWTLPLLALSAPRPCVAQAVDAAFHSAVIKGRIARVSEFLEQGVDPETRDQDGMTPLMLAARHGRVDVIKVLLEHNADMQATSWRTPDGDSAFTAVMVGTENDHGGVVSLLLERGADVNATSRRGLTAAMLAAAVGHQEILRILLASGADPNRRSVLLFGDSAVTALMLAAEEGSVTNTRALLQHGADLHASSRAGQSALSLAAYQGNLEVVRLLLDHGAVVDVTTHEGYTALMLAAEEGHTEVMDMLLARGADVNATSKRTSAGTSGLTALMSAAQYGHGEAVDFLIRHSADVNAKTQDGLTALMAAASAGHGGVAATLIEHGAVVTAQTEDGMTALMMAAMNGHTDVVTMLLDRGAGLNTTSYQSWQGAGGSALMFAAEGGHLEVVRTLIDRGASVDGRNSIGMTPLMFATGAGHLRVVQHLLDRGADPNARDNDGDAPLGYYAAQYGHAEIARVLLQSGADVNTRNDNDVTPVMYAKEGGHKEVVSLLEGAGAASPPAEADEAKADLSAVLPTLADFAEGVIISADQAVPSEYGAHRRAFQAARMVFDIGTSQIIMLNTAVEMGADSLNARTLVVVASAMDMSTIISALGPSLYEEMGYRPDTVIAEAVEIADVGDAAGGWLMRIETGFGDYDGYVIFFARERVTAQIMALGPRDKITLQDVTGVARLIDERIQGGRHALAATEPSSPASEPSAEALAKLAEGETLARQANIIDALAAYEEAQALDSLLDVSAEAWNTLCWYGALWNYAAEVMPACERAVELDPDAGWILDSRGVARARTGDFEGAIEDFEAFVSSLPGGDARALRQGWITALREGRDPFTAEVLASLRGPDAETLAAIEEAALDAGFDLPALLPTLRDLPSGVEIMEEGFVEESDVIGLYRRQFGASGPGLVFTIGTSKALVVETGVALYEDAAAATHSLQQDSEPDASALTEKLLGAEFADDPSIGMAIERTAGPSLGSARVGWKMTLDTPILQVEGYIVQFAADRIVAHVAMLGLPNQVALEDVVSVAHLVEQRIHR